MTRTELTHGGPRPAWCLALALMSSALWAQADPTLTPVIVAERGSPLAGSTVGSLLRIEGLDVDGLGRVIAQAVTGQGQRVVIRDLDLLQTLDGSLPSGPSAETDPYDTVSVSTDGHVAWTARLDGDGETALMLDDTVLLAPYEALSGPGIPPGSQLISADSVSLNDGLQLLVYGRFRVGFDTDEALVRLTPDATLSSWSAEVVSMESMTTNDGLLVRTLFDGRGEAYDIAADGSVLFCEITYTPEFPQFSFGGVRLWPADTLLVPWVAAPVFPGPGLTTVALRLAADGDWAARLDSGFEPLQEAVLHAGDVITAEGALLPGQGEPNDLLSAVRVGANDNVAFLHTDLETGQASLYLNDRLLLQDGDTVDGRTIERIRLPDFAPGEVNLKPPFALDRAGETAWVAVVFDDAEWALLRLDVGPWVSRGGALAGPGAALPRLAGSGSLEGGATTALALLDGVPGGSAILVIGLAELAAPFKGGVLCPSPDLIVAGLPLDAQGGWSATSPWPADVPAGLDLFWQAWMADPSGPAGFVATHCLRSTSP